MANYYTSCEEMPLYNFIKMVVLSDTKFLYLNDSLVGKEDQQANEAWSLILSEYNELAGGIEYAQMLSLVKEITIINNKLVIIQSIVDVLSRGYDPDLCEVLKTYGFWFEFSETSFREDLKKTVASARRLLIQKSEAEKEKSDIEYSQEIATERDFLNLTIQLGRFVGYKIDPKQTNVLEFIAYVDQFKEHNKPQPANG